MNENMIKIFNISNDPDIIVIDSSEDDDDENLICQNQNTETKEEVLAKVGLVQKENKVNPKNNKISSQSDLKEMLNDLTQQLSILEKYKKKLSGENHLTKIYSYLLFKKRIRKKFLYSIPFTLSSKKYSHAYYQRYFGIKAKTSLTIDKNCDRIIEDYERYCKMDKKKRKPVKFVKKKNEIIKKTLIQELRSQRVNFKKHIDLNKNDFNGANSNKYSTKLKFVSKKNDFNRMKHNTPSNGKIDTNIDLNKVTSNSSTGTKKCDVVIKKMSFHEMSKFGVSLVTRNLINRIVDKEKHKQNNDYDDVIVLSD